MTETAANRPPATHKLKCRKCGGTFLGDEYHQFCGVCVVKVAQEIAEMQLEVRNLIGPSKEPIEGGRPISIMADLAQIRLRHLESAVERHAVAEEEITKLRALVTRLTNVADALASELSDPGSEALAAIHCGRHFIYD